MRSWPELNRATVAWRKNSSTISSSKGVSDRNVTVTRSTSARSITTRYLPPQRLPPWVRTAGDEVKRIRSSDDVSQPAPGGLCARYLKLGFVEIDAHDGALGNALREREGHVTPAASDVQALGVRRNVQAIEGRSVVGDMTRAIRRRRSRPGMPPRMM